MDKIYVQVIPARIGLNDAPRKQAEHSKSAAASHLVHLLKILIILCLFFCSPAWTAQTWGYFNIIICDKWLLLMLLNSTRISR